MNASLLANATKIVPDTELLINMVRLRVRQLIRGARPLIMAAPGMGFCDVALSEIAAEKLTSEPSIGSNPEAATAAIISFPATATTKKAA